MKTKKIFISKPKNIPYKEFEKNMVNYHKLMSIDDSNSYYRNKFIKYKELFFSTRKPFKYEHWTKIKYTANLGASPGNTNLEPISKIPEGTMLKVLGYKIIRMNILGFDALFYRVEYCGNKGWVSDIYTNELGERGLDGRTF